MLLPDTLTDILQSIHLQSTILGTAHFTAPWSIRIPNDGNDKATMSQFGIREIAAQVGYTSEVSFSKAFKRWTGTAPGIYRRKYRMGNNLLESSAVQLILQGQFEANASLGT